MFYWFLPSLNDCRSCAHTCVIVLLNLLKNVKKQAKHSCKGHFSGTIRLIIQLLAETNQFLLICPYLFPFYPDVVQDCGVRNMGLYREQSRGKLLSFQRSELQCHYLSVVTLKLMFFFLFCFLRFLTELSLFSLWPPWWPPPWPTAPAAPGMQSVSSSHYVYGGSRGSLMVSPEGLVSPILLISIIS